MANNPFAEAAEVETGQRPWCYGGQCSDADAWEKCREMRPAIFQACDADRAARQEVAEERDPERISQPADTGEQVSSCKLFGQFHADWKRCRNCIRAEMPECKAVAAGREQEAALRAQEERLDTMGQLAADRREREASLSDAERRLRIQQELAWAVFGLTWDDVQIEHRLLLPPVCSEAGLFGLHPGVCERCELRAECQNNQRQCERSA